jgi:hypothetical protein
MGVFADDHCRTNSSFAVVVGDVPNAFITTILAEGKVLYERSRLS